MIDRGKVSVLGVQVDAVDYEAAVARIIDAATDGRAYGVSALAVHGVMTGFDDAEHISRLNDLALVTPDGQPVRWAMNWLHGTDLPDRVYGPKLTLLVCQAAADAGLPVFFYGSQQDTLDHLAERLPTLAPGIEIAGMRPSKFGTSTPE
ncbi:MAG: WecB/TagA/CpsF family glycosyltransferase, partial [Actinomycetota bacterium]